MGQILRCNCGQVEVQLKADPIVRARCFCDDCQHAEHELVAKHHARKVTEEDGGTSFALFRKDKYEVIKGGELLKPIKTRDPSITSRHLATCCNSVLFASFARGPHWISAYRKYLEAETAPEDYFIQTRFSDSQIDIPSGTTHAKSYPPRMMVSLLWSRFQMALGR